MSFNGVNTFYTLLNAMFFGDVRCFVDIPHMCLVSLGVDDDHRSRPSILEFELAAHILVGVAVAALRMWALRKEVHTSLMVAWIWLF